MKIKFRHLVSTLAIGSAAVAVIFAVSCGTDTDASDSSGASSGTTSAAAVGGAVQGSDNGTTAFAPPPKGTLWNIPEKLFGQMFGIASAEADNCNLSSVTCTAGVVTVTFNGCTSKNQRTVFTGGYTLTLGGGFSCPGTAFWKNYLSTVNASLFRTYVTGTSVVDADAITVTSNNTNPVGWDSAVTLTKNSTYNAYGLLRTVTAYNAGTKTSTQTLVNSGVEYVATGVTKKGKTETVWDHTISSLGNGLTVTHTFDYTAGTDTKTVASADASSGTIVQHNLAKWTGRNFFSGVTFQHGTSNYCGCFPTAGTINTTYSGSKTSFEQIAFNYATTQVCGSYSMQACSDASCATLTGTATAGVLKHCL